jgi:LacI family transcriptional regulator
MSDADRFVSYTQYDVRIEQFLRELPHPVGLFAANDNLALRVMRAARNIDLHIPDQLALLGCDDDELALALSSPELSSIELPAHKLGFTAAEILDRMMRGHRVSHEPILLAPVGVVRRGSTDILAVNDPDVLSAMRFIQDHAHESIQVPAVLSHVMLSRRSLELKFRKHLGKSPADAIRDARLLRAKHLLHATDKSIPAVAKLAGFGNTKHFARMFKEHAGVSPTAFRKTFQRR